MATPVYGYFGSNLSDLQAGINSAQAIDAQRMAAEQQARSKRMAALAQLQAERQRNATALQQSAADRDYDFRALAQQGRMADLDRAVRERELQEARRYRELQDALRQQQLEAGNVLAREEMQNRENIARIQAGRESPTMLRLQQELEAEQADRAATLSFLKNLSDTRKDIIKELSELKEGRSWYDVGAPGGRTSIPFFGEGKNPRTRNRYFELQQILNDLDASAQARGLPVSPEGGYVIPGLPQTIPQNMVPQDPYGLMSSNVVQSYMPKTNVLPSAATNKTTTTNRFLWTPQGVSRIQ